jgi:hypothetical protein
LPAALIVAVALAGCAAGKHDETSHEHATPWVADATVGPVFVRAVTVVPSTIASSASPTASTFPSQTATVGPAASATSLPTVTATATPGATNTPQLSPSPSASASASGSSGGAQAYLTMTLVSSVEDTLTNATLSSGGTVTPTDASTPLTVKPQQALIISDPETATTPGPALAITGLAQPLRLGTTVRVTLTFQNAGTVTLDAPVRNPAVA